MKLIAIVCCDKYFGIGKKNGLLFSLPMDMKFFRETTKGHVVAMGRKTLLSFPNGKPLKNRTNIVLTKDTNCIVEGAIVVHTFEEFTESIKKHLETEDVYVIGGASIYQQMLPYYDEALVTKVDADGKAEVFFPNLDENNDYECIEESEPIMDSGYEIRFTKYKNLNKKEL